MTDEQNSKCHVIIHTATVAASAIAAGLAQIPGSDAIPITGIQITMIISLGGVFGRDIARSAAESILAGAVAAVGGRTVSQFLVGWIPIWGNAINAATAATITEGIGWFVADNFSKEAEEQARAEREQEKQEKAAREAREEAKRKAKEEEAKKKEQPNSQPSTHPYTPPMGIPTVQNMPTQTQAEGMSIGQMLLCAVFSFVIATLCVLVEVKLENFVPRFKMWSAGAGIILVAAMNIVISVICRENGLKAKARAMMSYSNYIALVMNIVYSLVMSPVDLPDLFKEVHGWEEALLTILRMPFVNWGLALVAVLWWFNRKSKAS